jgi:hypothetical protein
MDAERGTRELTVSEELTPDSEEYAMQRESLRWDVSEELTGRRGPCAVISSLLIAALSSFSCRTYIHSIAFTRPHTAGFEPGYTLHSQLHSSPKLHTPNASPVKLVQSAGLQVKEQLKGDQ